MSTSYYLHSTDFPESVHIGVSAGDHWATDCSLIRNDDRPKWTITAELIAYLRDLEVRRSKYQFPPWIADEYGKTFTPDEAARMIYSHHVHRDYGPHAWSVTH